MKMQLFNVISVIILITHHFTDALPDTNIHIQHYDGPVYVNPKPDCCPLCNSPIKPGFTDTANPIDVRTPEVYPETTIYIKSPNTPCDEDKEEKQCGKSSRNCKNNPPTENTYGYTDNKVSGMLHTNTKGPHKTPVTCTDQARTYGNSYTGTGNLGTHFGYDYGTGNRPCVATETGNRPCVGTEPLYRPCVATEPLSSYLPITASQNNCCQVPILTYNSDQGVEPTLIPQKFMYSLILDGDVASSQNGYNPMYNYY